MKKIEFKFKLPDLSNVELVKGCPTDINGNGQNDDDYNQDGQIDGQDQDYYDGYMAGYEGDTSGNESHYGNDAYFSGYLNGDTDKDNDLLDPDNDNGPDILDPDFEKPEPIAPMIY